MSRLQKKYNTEIVPKLQKEFKLKNPMAVPKVTKVVINVGIGDIAKNKTSIQKALSYVSNLAGQKPALMKAKKSIAEFNIREGSPVGLKCSLRGKRAMEFLDKFFTLVLPRVRDFQGLKKKAFDGSGNYTIGLTEQIIFPEVEYDKIDKVRGMEITIVTNANNDKKAMRLLEEMGMVFEKKLNN